MSELSNTGSRLSRRDVLLGVATGGGAAVAISFAGASPAAAQEGLAVFNVHSYGTNVGTGDDDHAAFQAAADDADAHGGGIVWVPSGTYSFGVPGGVTPTLSLGSNTWLTGQGWGSRIKRASPGAAGVLQALVSNKGRKPSLGGSGTGNVGIVVADICLDGNKGSGGAINGGHGLYLDGAQRSRLLRVKALNCADTGIVIIDSKYLVAAGALVEGNAYNGLHVTNSDKVSLIGCHGRSNGTAGVGSSFVFSAAWFCSMTGCNAEADAATSVLLTQDSQYVTVTANFFQGIATAPAPVAPLVFTAEHPGRTGAYDPAVAYGCANCVIRDNTLHIPDGRPSPAVELRKSDGNEVVANRVAYTGGLGIVVSGSSHNVIRDNLLSNIGRNQVAGEDWAILVRDDPSPPGSAAPADSNDIDDNHIYASPRGIAFWRSESGSVIGNRMRRNRVDVTTEALYVAPGVVVEEGDPPPGVLPPDGKKPKKPKS